MEKTAYVFNELNAAFGEGKRLSAQAQAFVDIEMPGFLGKISPESRIGDFGCGTGVISAALAQCLPRATVVGLDRDEKALAMASENGAHFKNLSFERYGFGSDSLPQAGLLDVAFTRLVLLHLPDPAAAIAQMGRCLRPGGLLYLVDCDDDYVNFQPKEAWQDDMISLMKQAQLLRGGSRTLGSRLLGMLTEKGFWPEGCQVHYYSTENLGLSRWKGIFLPAMGNMLSRDLKFLLEKGLLKSETLGKLESQMKGFFEQPGCAAQLSAWHAWARKS